MPPNRPTDILDLIATLRAREAEFCVATVVRTENVTAARPGAKAVVLPDGTLHGFLGGGCVNGAVRRSAAAALSANQPQLIRVLPKEHVAPSAQAAAVEGVALHGSGCPSGGTVDIFIEPLRQPPALAVCGASPVAVAIADLGARLGYRVHVAAPRADLERFDPSYRRLPAYDLSALADRGSFIAVATQGVRDLDALEAALATDARYVGFVASRRKSTVLRQRLQDKRGASAETLERLVAPAGLDIDAIEPEEIALSILAQIVAVRRAAARQQQDHHQQAGEGTHNVPAA